MYLHIYILNKNLVQHDENPNFSSENSFFENRGFFDFDPPGVNNFSFFFEKSIFKAFFDFIFCF